MTRRLVMGEGPIDTCKMAFIGEAPGSQEERLGRPFVGPAGQHLVKIMHMVGISRADVYITNVLKEHPPNDDITPWFKAGSGKVFESEGFKRYKEQLWSELDGCSANVLVPLGNSALYALTGLVAIMKRRGSILSSCGLSTTRKVIPTIHPSAALRQYIFSHFIRRDLARILEESASPDISLPVRALKIRPSYFEACQYLEESYELSGVGFDVEVVNEELSCFCISKTPWDAMSIPLHSSTGEYFTPEQEMDVMLKLARVLENPGIVKKGQNIIFDGSFMLRKYGIKTRNVEDTMIATGIHTPDFPKGLDFITSVYTREPYYKDEGKKWFKVGGSDESFWLYNAKDGCVCDEAFPKLRAELISHDNLEAYEAQRLLIEPLMYMQERGMRIDVEGMKAANEEAGVKIIELTDRLHKCCGFDLNPDSPKQLATYFYKTKGFTPYYNQGSVTTNIDAMKRLARKGVEEAKLIMELRKWSKLKGTYFQMKFSADGRLRSAMNPVGTTTGRLSSSKDIFGEGGNVQNLPPVFKRFILADEGYVAYDVDLSGADNRVVAYIAPEQLMIAAFEAGVDLHRLTAGLILGIPAEEVSDEPGSSPLGGGLYSQRFWGKKANHSLNYGLGYKSFALRFELPESEAKFIVDRYHQAYPGVRQYHAWIQQKLGRDRVIENCFGRKRLFLDRWGDDLFKDAYSFIPQSTVADKINRQGIIEAYYHQDKYRELELLNQVHDSIVFQIPISAGWERHAEMLRSLVKSLETPVPWHGSTFLIPADVKMGLNLKDMEKVNVKEAKGLAERLHDIYEGQRVQRTVQTVDGDLNDSSSTAEEDEFDLGAGSEVLS